MKQDKYVNGKKILVVSATAEIARDFVLSLDQEDNTIYLTGRNQNKLSEIVSLFKKAQCKSILLDFTDDSYINKLKEFIDNIDGLVLFPGAYETIRVSRVYNDRKENLINLVFKAPVDIISTLLNAKVINRGASIVFISSIAAESVWIGNSIYGALKLGVERFCKSVALEYSGRKIRCNSLRIGFIESSLSEGISREYITESKKNYPLGEGVPSDIVGILHFLLDDSSRWITGQIISVDGGFLCN